MRGLADGLDPDSAFLSPAQVKAVEAGEALPDGDVGIELTRRYYLRRHRGARRLAGRRRRACRPATTSARSTASRRATCRSSKGTRLLRGQAGHEGHAHVIRGNAADPHEVVLVREKVAGPLVTSRLIGTTGYLRIVSFRNGVVEDLESRPPISRRAARRVSSSTCAARPKGRSRTASRPRASFVKTGHARDQSGPRQAEPREPVVGARRRRPIDLPVTVLVTTGTSGAGELFAAALERQQSRGAHRRAHARPRRHPETRQAARGPRPLAHLRALPHAERQPHSGHAASSRRRGRRARRRVRCDPHRTKIRSSTPRSNA